MSSELLLQIARQDLHLLITRAMLSRYCTRLESPSFWGGDVEILILSKMLRMPIHVMQSAKEAGR